MMYGTPAARTRFMFEATVLTVITVLNSPLTNPVDVPGQTTHSAYFPPPEAKGGWKKLDHHDEIRRQAGMDPDKLSELKDWLLKSDQRDFAAVVIRNGFIVLEVERGNSSKTDSRRVAS